MIRGLFFSEAVGTGGGLDLAVLELGGGEAGVAAEAELPQGDGFLSAHAGG